MPLARPASVPIHNDGHVAGQRRFGFRAEMGCLNAHTVTKSKIGLRLRIGLGFMDRRLQGDESRSKQSGGFAQLHFEWLTCWARPQGQEGLRTKGRGWGRGY